MKKFALLPSTVFRKPSSEQRIFRAILESLSFSIWRQSLNRILNLAVRNIAWRWIQRDTLVIWDVLVVVKRETIWKILRYHRKVTTSSYQVHYEKSWIRVESLVPKVKENTLTEFWISFSFSRQYLRFYVANAVKETVDNRCCKLQWGQALLTFTIPFIINTLNHSYTKWTHALFSKRRRLQSLSTPSSSFSTLSLFSPRLR